MGMGMVDSDRNDALFTDTNGDKFELAGYRLEGGEWQDIEAGAPLPEGKEWREIDLVTLNLAPDYEDGYYRNFELVEGFDELYTIEDLGTEAHELYE